MLMNHGRHRLIGLALAAGLFGAALAQSPAADALRPPPPMMPPVPAMPPLRFLVPEAKLPVQIASVSVRAELAGSLARTELELVLRNPNERVLEGTLEFPLQDGQSVDGFALDIGGELRPAVPVEKARGQQVFEEITRRRVDPALLERTAGNVYRLRVYPLPAKGTRRVVLQLLQPLAADAQGRGQWQLPLDFGQEIGKLDLSVTARGLEMKELKLGPEFQDALSKPLDDGTLLSLSRQDSRPQRPFTLSWAAAPRQVISTGRHEDRDYFYAELPVPEQRGPRLALRRLALVWDASGSGAQRDHDREFALLEALLRGSSQVDVQLVVSRDAAEPVRTFSVRGGDWRELRRHLEGLAYDGASNAGAWVAPAGQDLALLFSDGLANWGALQLPRSPAPLQAVSAAQRADLSRLRQLAEVSGGALVNLAMVDAAEAAETLLRPGLRVVDVKAEGAELVELASQRPEGARLALAGRLTAAEAMVTVQLQDARGRKQVHTLSISGSRERRSDGPPPLAAQRWADLRIARLETEASLHRAEIKRLGQQFHRLTSGSSLIVLDNLVDYVRYEIMPPPSMRQAYEAALARQLGQRQQSRSMHLDRLARRYEERISWWEREFPKDGKPVPKRAPAPPPVLNTPTTSMPAPAPIAASPAASFIAPPPAPAPRAAPVAAAAPAMMAEVATRARADGMPSSSASTATVASIQLQQWQPDAPHARRLREASAAQRYAIYMDERAGQARSTAFFLDAAEVFFSKGQAELGLRVLSNLAEMELESRALLRVLAYRLQQAGQVNLALPILERVRELAPEEPQSWRDLGLAFAAAGQPQRAIELLWDCASRPWDGRFADIDITALVELNALAARKPGLDVSMVDARLRRNLPLDVRAVLGWDADNTDIDLWVVDPNGDRTHYAAPLSYQGGKLSRDFTGGYGPEEFALRLAKPGRYEVRAQFFGHQQQILTPHTTLMLWLATGFGKPDQKDQQIVLRLSGRGDQVLVGTFEVK